ncbi:hypothetical protein [Treponema phagedenis]|uniref:Uncharacterized protein n=1 Tax=Treponema phagedenis TaxID=162 RepID=A0AAE6M5X6_TREPH|nr:hypothetical protein [Treponema phagedenis]QEJ96778.1 hypothetical protein FUT82_01375 [Treponema phagedenis]
MLAVKIGNSYKITIQELEEYYERRDPRCAGIVRELAGNIKRQRGGGCFQRKPNHYPSIDIQRNLNAYKIPGEREWNINKSDLKKFIERNETINN